MYWTYIIKNGLDKAFSNQEWINLFPEVWFAAKWNDTKQIAVIRLREDLDKLMKQSNVNPFSTEVQLEMKKNRSCSAS